MPRILIIGLGSIGRRHARNLRALGVSDIFVWRSRGVDTKPLEDNERVEVVSTLEDGLARKPDLVLVTNPTALHLDAARAAVRAGAHVFIEKPLSHTLVGIEDLLAAARVAGKQVFVGNNFRFHPTLVRAKEVLVAGAIGRPVTARFSVGEYLPDYHPWEDYRAGYSARKELGGGVMLTQIHDVDLLLWFFGMPSSVVSRVGRLGELGIDVEDVAEIVAQYGDRLIASVHQDYFEKPGKRSLVVVGTGGKMEWTAADGVLRVWTHAPFVSSPAFKAGDLDDRNKDSRFPTLHVGNDNKETPDEYAPPTGFDRNTMFVDEMRHVLEVIAGRGTSRIRGEDGRDAVAVVEAAKRSSETGCAVVPGATTVPELSLVIPAFNEVESLPELHRRLSGVLDALGRPAEIIFVDDGSTDGTSDLLRSLASRDRRVRVAALRRNFGKSYALTAGFREARGAVIVTLDADLQDQPEELPKLLARLSDAELVTGWRVRRNDPVDKTLPSRIYNALAGRFAGLRLHDINSGFKVYRREVVESLLPIYGEQHRLLPILAHRAGFRVAEVPVDHASRKHGVSKYGWSRGIRGLLDLFTVLFVGKFVDRPLHFFGPVGMLLGVVGFGFFVYLVVLRLQGATIGTRPLFSVSIFLMLTGLQFFFTGLLAELITRHAKREHN